MRKSIRQKALLIIQDVLNKGAFLDEELLILQDSNIDIRDYNLIVNLVTGVIENKLLLEHIIKINSKIKLKKIHPIIKNILSLGIYQIFFTDKIPEYSIVNESVKLAKIYRNSGSAGYINGMLRNILKNRDEIKKNNYYIDKKDIINYLSTLYSHPEFYINILLRSKNYEEVERILKINNSPAPFTIRLNTLKISKEDLVRELRNLNFIVKETKSSKFGIKVLNSNGILNTSLFKKGYFYVQDEASILVGENHIINDGDLILDMCASPGGKSFNVAMRNKSISIISCDVSNKKIRRIEENKNRLGIENIKTMVSDGCKFNNDFISKFDSIIIDAPCSGVGLYRRHPDIKWNKTLEDINNLTDIQFKILSNGAKYVKPLGYITYSTCSITEEENENLIERFLNENSNFKIIKTNNEDTYKLYPTDECDGFSITRLQRMI